MYTYQSDWFTEQIPLWEQYLAEFKGKDSLSFLEIGSFEGRSAVWLLTNILTGEHAKLVCIDTFEGSVENQTKAGIDLSQIEAHFDMNIEHTGAAHKVQKIKETSASAFRKLAFDSYDCIYIDGSHTAPDVLSDAVMYFHLLKKGGLMIFDDYIWEEPGMKDLDTPQPAIDAFLMIYDRKIEVLYKGIQVILRKKK